MGTAHRLRSDGARERSEDPERVEIGRIEYRRTRVVPVSSAVLERNRLLSDPRSPMASAYKNLRTQVLQRMREHGWRSIAVVSPAPGDGKTLSAINLSISLARDVHHTVLLADLDLHHPSVHRCFELAPVLGLNDHLADGAAIEDVLINPGVQRLVLAPTTRATESSSELLGSERAHALVQELAQRYPARIVVYDLPPVLAADDALAFLPNVDAVLLVMRDGKTLQRDLSRTLELIGTKPLLGTVLNRADTKDLPYYYRYG
jgi:capsular exopolysaccharide synthesis family protein